MRRDYLIYNPYWIAAFAPGSALVSGRTCAERQKGQGVVTDLFLPVSEQVVRFVMNECHHKCPSVHHQMITAEMTLSFLTTVWLRPVYDTTYTEVIESENPTGIKKKIV